MQTPPPNGPGDGAASANSGHGVRDGHSAHGVYTGHSGNGSLSNDGMVMPAPEARPNGRSDSVPWSMFPKNNVGRHNGTSRPSTAAQSGKGWDIVSPSKGPVSPFSGCLPTQPAGLVSPKSSLFVWSKSVLSSVPVVVAAKARSSANMANTATANTANTNTAILNSANIAATTAAPAAPTSSLPVSMADLRPTPVFKNPLDTFASPPPASKRQRTGYAADDTSSSTATNHSLKLSPTSPTASLPILRSQPLPTPAVARRTGSWSGSSPMSAAHRLAQRPMAPPRPKVPTGFRQSIEHNRVVYVLEDDDDDDNDGDDTQGQAESSVPTPTLLAKAALETLLAPLQSNSVPPTLNNIASPPAPVLSPAPCAPASAMSPSTTAQPVAPAVPQLPVQQTAQHVAEKAHLVHYPATAQINPSPTTTTHNTQPSSSNAARNFSHDKLGHGITVPSSMTFKSSPTSSFSALNQVSAASGHAAASISPNLSPHPSPRPSLPPLSVVQPPQTQPPQTQHTITNPLQKDQAKFTRFANLGRRPYLQYRYRDFVANNYQDVQKLLGQAENSVIHVDFLPGEVQAIFDAIRSTTVPTGTVPEASKCKSLVSEKEVKALRKKDPELLNQAAMAVDLSRLPGRSRADIIAFFADVRSGETRALSSRPPSAPSALALCRHDRASHFQHEVRMARASKISTVLFGREMVGQRILAGRMRQPVNVVNEIRNLREDSLTPCHEWANCAGDVITISWTSNDTFICGTTTHMDDRNQQYNRQGNLASGSLKTGRLIAYPDHRIARRPQTESGNPTTAHLHDDPWLYTSVVSSDFTAALDLAFTSSFDHTVKAWRIEKDGSMRPMGTWPHNGKVNFVVASTHEIGLVATAADVPGKSARIYRLFDPRENGRITYKALPCPRIFDSAGRALIPDKWAYLPAAVRWGLSKDTNHLLLVGFSPRGLNLLDTDDEDIPADRRDTGELRLWDGRSGAAWQVNGPRRNVFEVAWHPSDACFIAATASNTHHGDENMRTHIRTQIRVYRPAKTTDNGGRVYAEVQTLDCYADDINELTLMPNSFRFMFVAVGATNGKTYVWDTSQGDYPIHVLAHGKCVEELGGERISTEDTGVKFVCWGQTADRLYTGSSDGVVKVWNVRTHKDSHASPFVRDLLHCPGPVSFGAFSPDKSKLAIGDATGHVAVLSVDDSLENNDEDDEFLSDTEDDEHTPQNQQQQQQQQQQRQCKTYKQHPPEIIRHPAPPPPPPQVPTVPAAPSSTLKTADARGNGDDDGCAPARAFLASGQIVIVPDRTIGAVKGPNYAETGLYCRDFRLGQQLHAPLLAQYDRFQQENQPPARLAPSRQRRLGKCGIGAKQLIALHERNRRQDLTVGDLEMSTLVKLQVDDRGIIESLNDAYDGHDEPYDFGFDYEELPSNL